MDWQQRAADPGVWRALAQAHPWACTPTHEHRGRARDSERRPLFGYPHSLASRVGPCLRVCLPVGPSAGAGSEDSGSAEQCSTHPGPLWPSSCSARPFLWVTLEKGGRVAHRIHFISSLVLLASGYLPTAAEATPDMCAQTPSYSAGVLTSVPGGRASWLGILKLRTLEPHSPLQSWAWILVVPTLSISLPPAPLALTLFLLLLFHPPRIPGEPSIPPLPFSVCQGLFSGSRQTLSLSEDIADSILPAVVAVCLQHST